MNIKIDQAKLNQAISKAFRQTVQDYAAQCQEELRTPKWDWPGETERQNGETVGSPRDIVDEGELADSQQEPQFTESDSEIVGTIEWTSDHAAVVFTGLVDAQDVYPGREWTLAALQDLPIDKRFAKHLRKELGA